MTLPPGLRKLALTTHVTSSVGWLGAVAVFLVLAVAGLSSGSPQVVRASYLAADLATWYVIVPLCLASLVTGIVQSLVSSWGLFRHYWVLAKLVLTVLATVLLLVHTQPIGHLGGVAAGGGALGPDLGGMRIQLVVDACAALLVLLVTTTLSVYKPRGTTRFGRRSRAAVPRF